MLTECQERHLRMLADPEYGRPISDGERQAILAALAEIQRSQSGAGGRKNAAADTDPLTDFAVKVKLMRDVQREVLSKGYPKSNVLMQSMAAEQAVDEVIRKLLEDDRQGETS